MTGLFDTLFGRRGGAGDGPLAAALAHYPPNVPAHVGPAKRLTAEMAEENLRRFLATREERLSALTAVLNDHDVDVSPILDPAADPAPVLEVLSAWLSQALPPRPAMPGGAAVNAPIDAFVASERRGGDILFSFVADLALLEGEGIVRRRTEWRWDLDRLPGDAGTYPYRRVVLWRDKQGARPALALDLEHETLETIYAMRGRAPQVGHPLGRTLTGVVAGGFDHI